MSLGYADRLKQRRNLGGQLGAKEYHDSFDNIKTSVQALARWVSEAKRVFVFTGAGISTACGIPDFRGPNGIWTLRKKKLPVPSDLTPFEFAKPSFTHMAIAGLVAAGKVPYVCSQNVDSLHLWSGVPRSQLAELHGNCFAERCSLCRTEYARDFQMETVDFQPSGRLCSQPGCGGALVDNILDWETPLPEDELNEAVQQAEEADVALVLGTSLQIQPANEIPTLTRDEGGKMVIVNLQKTPKDRKANLIIRGRVDLVMALLVQELGVQVPPYVRTEVLVVEHQLLQPPDPLADGSGGGGRRLTVSVCSRHGASCPIPMVESLTISVAAVVPVASGTAKPASAACLGDGAAVVPAGSSDAAEPVGGDDEGRLAAVGGAGGEAAASTGVFGSAAAGGPSWGPYSSGVLTAAADAAAAASTSRPVGRTPEPGPASPSPSPCNGTGGEAGGGDGGLPYRYTFTGIPEDVRRLQCTIHVRLVKWADEDRREVVLRHEVDLDALAAPAPLGGGDGCGGNSGSGSAAAAATSASPTCSPTVSTHTHSFISQQLQYDPAQVVAAFLANPAPIVLPEPPRKRQKTQPGGAGAGAAVPPRLQPTRVSLRRARPSQKAQEAEAASGSQTPSTGQSVESSSDGDE